jgi:hypothetical protein
MKVVSKMSVEHYEHSKKFAEEQHEAGKAQIEEQLRQLDERRDQVLSGAKPTVFDATEHDDDEPKEIGEGIVVMKGMYYVQSPDATFAFHPDELGLVWQEVK